jgi:D-lactate dehydrogenase (cytochrome)
MAVLNTGGYTKPIIFDEKPTLFFKFSGTNASVSDNIREVEAISKANKGGAFRYAKNEKEQEIIWSGRKQALWSLLAARPEGTELWTTDVAVPYSSLATMIGKSNLVKD